MHWEDDLLALRDRRPAVPARAMLLRHWRSGPSGGRVIDFLEDDLGPSGLSVALYPVGAPAGSKPSVVFDADAELDLHTVPQQAEVTVLGWPEPGRAVLVEVADISIVARSPCRPAGWRAPRLEASPD